MIPPNFRSLSKCRCLVSSRSRATSPTEPRSRHADAADAGKVPSEKLQRIIWRLEKLPRKEPGPALWTALGRCIGDLEALRDELGGRAS